MSHTKLDQDTIPELMDKLKYVDAADLGYDELSDGEEEAVHINVKGSVATRRTRVLKGVVLEKTFEPPSHYMCDGCCGSICFSNSNPSLQTHA
jgi:hypothetical protein